MTNSLGQIAGATISIPDLDHAIAAYSQYLGKDQPIGVVCRVRDAAATALRGMGYVAAVALAQPGPAPNHKIISPRSFVFPGPDLKLPIEAALPYGALVQITDRRDGYGFVPYLGWISEHNLGALNAQISDPVALALRFVEAPYLWGGRTAVGCECSGLVQTVLEAAGMQCPRDADQQQAHFAETTSPRQRGDLVFWQGHVGMMVDGVQLVHANAYHMAVQVEPLADTLARYEAKGLTVLATCRP